MKVLHIWFLIFLSVCVNIWYLSDQWWIPFTVFVLESYSYIITFTLNGYMWGILSHICWSKLHFSPFKYVTLRNKHGNSSPGTFLIHCGTEFRFLWCYSSMPYNKLDNCKIKHDHQRNTSENNANYLIVPVMPGLTHSCISEILKKKKTAGPAGLPTYKSW